MLDDLRIRSIQDNPNQLSDQQQNKYKQKLLSKNRVIDLERNILQVLIIIIFIYYLYY